MPNRTRCIQHSIRWRIVFVLSFTALAAIFVYRDAVIEVTQSVLHREGSSHGLFVPFLTAWFVWINRNVLKRLNVKYDFVGIPLIVMGISPPLFGIESLQLQFLGLIVFIWGLTGLLLGRAFLWRLAFPILFLITMTPIPEPIFDQTADFLRSINFWASLKILDVFSVPYFREGWMLHLPESVLKVAIGCSGIRYLISYLVFAAAYGYLFKTSWKGRLLILTLSIPIAFLASIIRLSLIFLLSYYISPRLSEHGPHVVISWIVFFAILMASMLVDRRISEGHERNASGSKDSALSFK